MMPPRLARDAISFLEGHAVSDVAKRMTDRAREMTARMSSPVWYLAMLYTLRGAVDMATAPLSSVPRDARALVTARSLIAQLDVEITRAELKAAPKAASK